MQNDVNRKYPKTRMSQKKKTNTRMNDRFQEREEYKNDEVASDDIHVDAELCAACAEERKQVKGVKFCIDCNQIICQVCADLHRRVKQIKDHKLVRLDDADVLKSARLLAESLHCPNHPEKRIELFCKDHRVMCCLTCATVRHRNCVHVQEISELAREIDKTGEASRYFTHLEAAKQFVTRVISLQAKHKEELKSNLDTKLPKTVNDIKRKVNEAMTNLEKSILTRSKDLADIEFAKYDSEGKKWQEVSDSVGKTTKLLETVKENGSDAHFIIALETLRKNLQRIDEIISEQGEDIVLAKTLVCAENYPLLDIYGETRQPSVLVNISVRSFTVQLPHYSFANTGKTLEQTEAQQAEPVKASYQRPGEQIKQDNERSFCNPKETSSNEMGQTQERNDSWRRDSRRSPSGWRERERGRTSNPQETSSNDMVQTKESNDSWRRDSRRSPSGWRERERGRTSNPKETSSNDMDQTQERNDRWRRDSRRSPSVWRERERGRTSNPQETSSNDMDQTQERNDSWRRDSHRSVPNWRERWQSEESR